MIGSVLVLHGPNLNLLGQREPELYGSDTLIALNNRLQQHAASLNFALQCKQSNHEGQLIDWVQQAQADEVDFIIINAGAYTHTSLALRDALIGVAIPFVEVHLTNVHAREDFRQHSYLADRAQGVICGFGAHSYIFALQAAAQHLQTSSPQ